MRQLLRGSFAGLRLLCVFTLRSFSPESRHTLSHPCQLQNSVGGTCLPLPSQTRSTLLPRLPPLHENEFVPQATVTHPRLRTRVCRHCRFHGLGRRYQDAGEQSQKRKGRNVCRGPFYVGNIINQLFCSAEGFGFPPPLFGRGLIITCMRFPSSFGKASATP